MEDTESAVLDAARKWVAAKEAILAADEAREGDRIATESALDQAEYELTDAIRELAQSGKKVKALELTGEWADVRDPEILAKLNQ